MRHGPHHSAQKSTTTGSADFKTSDSKLASDTLPTAMAVTSCVERSESAPKIARAGNYERGPAASRRSRVGDPTLRLIKDLGRKLHEIRHFRPDQRGANQPTWVNLLQHGAVKRELSLVCVWHFSESPWWICVGLEIGNQDCVWRNGETIDLARNDHGFAASIERANNGNFSAAACGKRSAEARIIEQRDDPLRQLSALVFGHRAAVPCQIIVGGLSPPRGGKIRQRLQQPMREPATQAGGLAIYAAPGRTDVLLGRIGWPQDPHPP